MIVGGFHSVETLFISYKVESDLFRKDLGWTFKKKQWNHHLDLVGGFNPYEKY